jgi:hypothetical protein
MSRRALALLFGIAEIAACSMDWAVPNEAIEGGVEPIESGPDVAFVLNDANALQDAPPGDALVLDVNLPDGRDAGLDIGKGDVGPVDTGPPPPCAMCNAGQVCAYQDRMCGLSAPLSCTSKTVFCLNGTVCGCDGNFYPGDCQALEAGTTPTDVDNCPQQPANTVRCGQYRYCTTIGGVCVRNSGVDFCASKNGCGPGCNCLLNQYCGDAGGFCNGAVEIVTCNP